MFAVSDHNRRIARDATEAPREIPVLFHLLDVTPRQPAPPAPPPAVETALAPPVATPPPVAPPAATPLDISSASVTLATAVAEGPAIIAEPVPEPVAPADSASNPSESLLATSVAESAAESPHVPEPQASEPTANSTTEPVAESAHAANDAATPSVQLPERRTRKTSPSEDWFATHGKYITLGFALALVVTVLVARATRPPAASVAQPPGVTPLVDEPAITYSTQPAATPSRPEATSSVAVAAGPARNFETASALAESKVELQPPVTQTPLAQSAANSPNKDGLFDFSPPKTADERVASRVDAVSRSPGVAPATTAPPLAPTLAAPAQTDLGPAYPTTASPLPVFPVTSAAANANRAPPALPPNQPPPPGFTNPYAAAPPPGAVQGPAPPVANYRSAYPAGPGPAAPAAAQSSTVPAPYQPSYNTASGRRYEPTGSGNY